jgi:hypothetical protein
MLDLLKQHLIEYMTTEAHLKDPFPLNCFVTTESNENQTTVVLNCGVLS